MHLRSYLYRAGASVLAIAGFGFTAAGLNGYAANAAVRRVGSHCDVCSSLAGYTFQTGEAEYGTDKVIERTTFVVPRLRCGSAFQAIAPGLEASVGNVGRTSEAALFVGCRGGRAHYWPRLTLAGKSKNYRAKAAYAGDTIALRVAYDRKRGSVSVTDETHKFEVSRTGAGAGSVYAWIGDAAWRTSAVSFARVPDFGTLTYRNTKLNGRPLAVAAHFSLVRNVMGTEHGRVQINTSPLASSGKAFSTYFKHH
jgi:hypothetical protein